MTSHVEVVNINTDNIYLTITPGLQFRMNLIYNGRHRELTTQYGF